MPELIKPETLTMIRQLVSFDTTSRKSNLGLIEWVRDWLKALGVESQLVYDPGLRKANLFATITGSCDAGGRPGIVLSGHTDVVPVDGQKWDTDPFKVVIKDDRIYARGACDMKAYIGTALAMAPHFVNSRLNMPIHFALSYDEEVGCLGVRGLLEALARQSLCVSGCIVGEPTSMQVVTAHKGRRSYECSVVGQEAHSALTNRGVNAIEYAARLVARIRDIADRLAGGNQISGYEVPYTTLQTGTISGGLISNIVPGFCKFQFEVRYVPESDPDAIELEIREYAEVLRKEMKAWAPHTDIVINLNTSTPACNIEESAEITRLVLSITTNPSLGKVSYGTEAGLFQQAGIPTVICGPGSMQQAHRPNEFVSISQVMACEAFMAKLANNLSATD